MRGGAAPTPSDSPSNHCASGYYCVSICESAERYPKSLRRPRELQELQRNLQIREAVPQGASQTSGALVDESPPLKGGWGVEP